MLDKLVKVSESFTVNMYSNGYMIEVNGRDSEGDWKTVKIILKSEEELVDLIGKIIQLERDN